MTSLKKLFNDAIELLTTGTGDSESPDGLRGICLRQVETKHFTDSCLTSCSFFSTSGRDFHGRTHKAWSPDYANQSSSWVKIFYSDFPIRLFWKNRAASGFINKGEIRACRNMIVGTKKSDTSLRQIDHAGSFARHLEREDLIIAITTLPDEDKKGSRRTSPPDRVKIAAQGFFLRTKTSSAPNIPGVSDSFGRTATTTAG